MTMKMMGRRYLRQGGNTSSNFRLLARSRCQCLGAAIKHAKNLAVIREGTRVKIDVYFGSSCIGVLADHCVSLVTL